MGQTNRTRSRTLVAHGLVVHISKERGDQIHDLVRLATQDDRGRFAQPTLRRTYGAAWSGSRKILRSATDTERGIVIDKHDGGDATISSYLDDLG
jgi:hypothetical protein